MSDTVNFSSLHPLVMPEVPNCPIPLINQEIYVSLRHFCRETHAWNETLEPLSIRADVAMYPIDIAYDHGRLWSVMKVQRNNITLRPYVDYRITDNDLTFTMTPTQAETRSLVIRVAFEPAAGTTLIDEKLFNDWSVELACAVKSRLMLMPEKTWSQPAQGAYYRTEAANGLVNAKIKIMNEMSTNKKNRVTPKHRFA